MRIGERYEFAREQQDRYAAAGKRERSRILDSFCLATGYDRKYAIRMLRGRKRVSVRRARRRASLYGRDFQKALRIAWEASGYICSQRLQPFLPELVPLLEKHGHLPIDDVTRGLLLQASASTVERNLKFLRHGLLSRKMSQTKPGTLLRKQIPAIVGRWADKDVPGYLEIDLVSHSGEFAAGTFIYTLSAVDLCTGWTERIPILGKGQAGIVAALHRIREQLPFPLLGIHPDSGGEFINWQLFAYCEEANIEFSRSRPFHKNDNAHVEQKNWTLVRRLIGYQRLDTPEQLAWLDSFYIDLLRPYANCFQPVMKLLEKETVNNRTRRKYDTPATPMRRLLLTHAQDVIRTQPLLALYESVSPLTLKRQIDRRLVAMPATLAEVASA